MNNTQQNLAIEILTQSPLKFIEFKKNSKSKIIILITILLLLVTCSIALITAFLIIFVKKSDSISKNINCAANSTKIGNICYCSYGYSGDGLNYCDECGLVYNKPNIRIVGGTDAAENSWPSASLIIFSYKEDIHLPSIKKTVTISFTSKCGGTLLNRNTILSAAHCILKRVTFEYNGISYETSIKTSVYYPTIESMYKVYLGAYNVSLISSQVTNHEYSVSKIIIHEKYSKTNEINDISLLKLTKLVQLDEYLQITCLPDPLLGSIYPIAYPVTSYAIGWGTLSFLGSSSDVLNNVKLTIYNNSMCSLVLPDTAKNWKSQLCAGDFSGDKDTCQGDSGGSLFVQDLVNGKTKYITAGIVSYGDECGKKASPGIYTRTSFYVEWIKRYS